MTIALYKLIGPIMLPLQKQTTSHGYSIEEEARQILLKAFPQEIDIRSLGSRIRTRFGECNGVELELPSRNP
ncbi:FitA-like ribbon-helix-helix domain-containing protein [Pseudomonas sp. 22526]|uniref:FitA-like ribbon-helix-helix domain-containing protein n=1 Tax=Pseudomonas sp. 22526 TaxID=3453937 RepID=UPI003F84118B